MVWRCFAANGAGAVFHVYDRHALDRPPRRYVVGAGDRIDGEWRYDADGRDDLWMLGPNGFHRHFAGQQGEPVPAVAWTIDDAGLALTVPHGNPGLRLSRLTPGGGASEEALAPGRYLWSLDHVLGWYDITLTHAAQPAWRRRLAGRHDCPGRRASAIPSSKACPDGHPVPDRAGPCRRRPSSTARSLRRDIAADRRTLAPVE